MPLKPGKSRKVISQNIKEFHGGQTFARTEAKFGKARAEKQAVAVALHNAGKSRKDKGRQRPKPDAPKHIGGYGASSW